jgi:uncharacterized protein (TIGR03083 family)
LAVTFSIDLPAGQAALRSATARTAELVRSAPNAAAPVPGLDWTVGETAAHLVGDLEHYRGYVTGQRDAAEYLALTPGAQNALERTVVGNARMLQEITERDLGRLADMMTLGADSFIAAAGQRSPDELILTETGVSMTVPVMTTALLGEQLIHGLDIARAVGRPWPISRDDALLVIAGVIAMIPEYLDQNKAAGLHITYELRFRGGPRYRMVIDDGTAVVGEPNGTVDCWISADPVAFLLIGYGRIGQWGAVLRGKIVSGGRKPWLGLKFGGLLTSV